MDDVPTLLFDPVVDTDDRRACTGVGNIAGSFSLPEVVLAVVDAGETPTEETLDLRGAEVEDGIATVGPDPRRPVIAAASGTDPLRPV